MTSCNKCASRIGHIVLTPPSAQRYFARLLVFSRPHDDGATRGSAVRARLHCTPSLHASTLHCSQKHVLIFVCRYLPWAANSDSRFSSIPERLLSAPVHQQLRDSDLTLPLPLVRGLFSQGLRMSACWSMAIEGVDSDLKEQSDANGKASWRSEALCAEDDALYHGFEENKWPKLELR